MNVTEFAARVKAKYPEYATLDDSDLTARIVAKHPQYGSVVTLDPQTAIAERKVSPPPAATGDPNAEQSQLSGGDIAGAIGRGVARMFGVPTNLHDAAAQYASMLAGPAVGAATQAIGMARNAMDYGSQAANAKSVAGKISKAAGVIPVVGPAISDLSQPSVATMEGRPATKEENIGAIEGGTQLAGQAAMMSPTVQAAAGRVAAPIGKMVDAAGTALTETLPSKISNATIGATRKYFRFGANPGETIKNMTYNSIEELPDRIQTEKIVPLAKKLNTILSTDAAQTKVIDLDGNIEHAFQEKIAKAQRDNNVSLEQTLQDRLMGRLDTAHQQSGGARYVSPDIAYEVMQQLGKDTKWTNDPVEGTVEDAKQTAYQNINAAIDKAIPAAVPLTRQLANALTAQKAIKTSIDTGQATHPLIGAMNTLRRVGGIAGAIGSTIAGHPEAGIASAAAAFAPDVLTATPVSSRISAVLSRFARPDAPLPTTAPSTIPVVGWQPGNQAYAEILKQMGLQLSDGGLP